MAQCYGMMSDTPDHHCPSCGTPQRAFERYPWYFCQVCLKLAEDGVGNRLEFANASLSGGLKWRLVGDEAWSDAITVICQIKTRPVTVQEARFGGVVAEPLDEARRRDDKHTTDLRWV